MEWPENGYGSGGGMYPRGRRCPKSARFALESSEEGIAIVFEETRFIFKKQCPDCGAGIHTSQKIKPLGGDTIIMLENSKDATVIVFEGVRHTFERECLYCGLRRNEALRSTWDRCK